MPGSVQKTGAYDSPHTLGKKSAYVSANIATFENDGIEIAFVRKEFFCENGSPAEQVYRAPKPSTPVRGNAGT